MKVSDFSYGLPDELIAQHPPLERGTSRLLVMDRKTGSLEHSYYSRLSDYLQPGDIIVLNDTKVIKARLAAINERGQARELLLLEDHHNTDFTRRRALYRGRVRNGEVLTINDTEVKIEGIYEGGVALISSSTNLLELADKSGTVPLPPYMHRDATSEDIERYQTVFARQPGSVAAPTASLNFTPELESKLRDKGVGIAYLTLHVGLGTFLPIRSDDIEEHEMHSEYFEIPEETVRTIRSAKENKRRVIAVGTTVTRTLEFTHQQLMDPSSSYITGEADIFIYPGYEFKIVDSMLTNFHAPKSTVLMMAAAFAGWDNLHHAYQTAVNHKYAFLSYGDSMLIL